MRKEIELVVSAIVGVVAGSVATHIYEKSKLEEEYRQRLEEDRKAVRAAYTRILNMKLVANGLPTVSNGYIEQNFEEPKEETVLVEKSEIDSDTKKAPKLDRTKYNDYTTFYNPENSGKDSESSEKAEIPYYLQEPDPHYEDDPNYIVPTIMEDADGVSIGDNEETMDYNVEYITFFTQNVTFTTENGDVMSRAKASSILGSDNINNVIFGARDGDLFYIRNDNDKTIYGVDILDASYGTDDDDD